jgi:hypothetical protein
MDIRKQMREQKRRLYGLMRNADSSATGATASALIDSLAKAQERIERITYDHFREVRRLCTPQQQTQFDDVIGDALERMR